MSNPAVFSIIAQIEQSLQILRTMLGQRQFPAAPQQPPQQQQYLSRQEEQALGEAVDYPPQFQQPPQYPPQQPGYPPQVAYDPRQQPQYAPQAPVYQPPANQAASARLLSQILGGGGGA